MSRIEDSQSLDMAGRLEELERHAWHLQHQVNELQRIDLVIKEIRIVELSYQDRCASGTATMNRLLEDGFELHKQFQTESGIIVEMVVWRKENE